MIQKAQKYLKESGKHYPTVSKQLGEKKMLDALKTPENNAISEEIRAEIQQAWNERVKENRLQATAEL